MNKMPRKETSEGMDRPLRRFNDFLREEAAEWLVRFCEEEVDAAGREAFNAWLRTSPEHVRTYLRMSAFWESADGIDRNKKRDLDALAARALAESNVVALSDAAATAFPVTPAVPSGPISPRPVSSRLASSRRGFLLAASVAAVFLTSGLLAWNVYRAPAYSTAIGEQRTITLPDGSAVALNARSRIVVRFTDSQRLIELSEGQALFTAAKDAARPFIVRSGATSIKAVGTQFDVHRKPAGTVITVIEGRVAVSSSSIPPSARSRGEGPGEVGPSLLSVGEQTTVTAHSISTPKRTSITTASAWTNNLLVFDATPLSEVVDEYNRHNLKPLVIDTAELNTLQISGTFPASGPERITSFLRERFGVSAREAGDEIRLSGAPR